MALFAIGDLHLSMDGEKSMEKFRGWENYARRLEENWKNLIKPDDTVVLAGDSSWGMTLDGALPDLRFIDALPGNKYLLKGNHDYWWITKAKMDRFFAENGLITLNILHNNAILADGVAVCGTRGWMLEDGKPEDKKVSAREAIRLEASLKFADSLSPDAEKIVFLHYPPLFGRDESAGMIELLRQYGVRRCYYGHIHSDGCAYAFNGERYGISFRLISADFMKFKPLLIE